MTTSPESGRQPRDAAPREAASGDAAPQEAVSGDAAPREAAAKAAAPRGAAGAGLRFAFGLLTVVPVRVDRWDRAAARAGMACAPVVGLVVGLLAAGVGAVPLLAHGGPLLAAVATVAVPAYLTRGLHLDGLADTADGLGSNKSAGEALRVMKASDIGPFGVLTLTLVILAQVAAVSQLYVDGRLTGATAAVIAALAARLALTLACREGVPAARRDGLGATAAASVPVSVAAAVTAAVLLVAAGLGTVRPDPALPLDAVRPVVAVLAGVGCGELLLRRCLRRFGGVTGDVLGATAETAATATLVALALI